jgi:hypothetical protein
VSETDIRAAGARAYIRGCALPPHGDVPYPRADLDDIRLPRDIADAGRQPATVHLAFTAAAEEALIS